MSMYSRWGLILLGVMGVLCAASACARRDAADGDGARDDARERAVPAPPRPAQAVTVDASNAPPHPQILGEAAQANWKELAALPPIERHARYLVVEPGSSLVLTSEDTDQIMHHYRYEQDYLGVRVYGRNYVVNEYHDGRGPWVGGGITVQGLAKSIPTVQSTLTAEQAVALGERVAIGDAVGRADAKLHDDGVHKYIYLVDDVPRLVYLMSFHGHHPDADGPYEPSIVLDANTGELLDRWNNVRE